MNRLEISDFRFYITCMVKSFLTKHEIDQIKEGLNAERAMKILNITTDDTLKAKYRKIHDESLNNLSPTSKKLFDKYKEKRESILKIFRQYIQADELKDIELNIIPLSPFQYHEYNYLIAVELRIGALNTEMEQKPRSAFEMSRKIKKTMEVINIENDEIWCDHLNLHPYAPVVSNKVVGVESVRWDKATILENKEILSPWIEYYSGQWDDYSEELHTSRVEGNLSNRTSELHYIRSNSAFIYMESKDPRWVEWLEGYMQDYFINQILLARALLYCLMIVNDELDEVSERLRHLTEGAFKQIEEEVNRVEELNIAVSESLTVLNKERLMNRLSHSTKVVKRCFDVFSLGESAELVSNKVKEIQQMTHSEYQRANEKIQKEQQRWMLILNALIGSQILFTVKDQLQSIPFIGTNPAFTSFFEWSIWIIFGILLVVSIGGLAISFVKRKTKWFERRDVDLNDG